VLTVSSLTLNVPCILVFVFTGVCVCKGGERDRGWGGESMWTCPSCLGLRVVLLCLLVYVPVSSDDMFFSVSALSLSVRVCVGTSKLCRLYSRIL
jgi:hypothetical protein